MLTKAFFAGALYAASICACDAASITLDAARFPTSDPTGVSDSTLAVQSALDEAAGGALILPKGVYSVKSLVLPAAGVNISAKGAKLQLAADAADGVPILRLPPNARNIEISGLEIDGRAQLYPNLKRISAIKSSGDASMIVLKAMYIHDIPLSAVELSDGDSHWEVVGNRIEHNGRHGIVVDFVRRQAHDLQFSDNSISYCGFGPIMIIAANGEGGSNDPGSIASAGAANVTISSNHISHNGLDIAGYSPNNVHIVVSDNTIEDNGIVDKMGHAIHIAGADIVIKDNIARNTAISAIVVSAWPNSNPTPTHGFEVTGNTIEGVLSARNSKGVLIQNASQGIISGNTISGARECPIEVDGDALGHGGPRIQDVAISDNAIRDNRGMGKQGVCVANGDNVTIK